MKESLNVNESSRRTVGDILLEAFPEKKEYIVAGNLDGKISALQMEIEGEHVLRPIFLQSNAGQRVYRRSVVFLLIIAVRRLFAEAEVSVRFTANKGLYCDVSCKGHTLTGQDVADIEAEMRQLIALKHPITKQYLSKEKAIQLFKETKQIAKVNLIHALNQPEVSIYFCGEYYDYFYGPLVDNTEKLDKFALDFEAPGILLRTPAGGIEPAPKVNQPKLKGILTESKKWAGILHCDYIPDLNRFIRKNEIRDIIRVSEALHEKRISDIADEITHNINKARLIMIAGPSSSGKTSFAQRLKVQLRVNGLEPLTLSLDDYFVERVNNPRTEDGDYDFESLYALDLDLINKHLVKLLRGEPIMHPKYDFVSGTRTLDAVGPISLAAGQPLLIEGIHGLNEQLTAAVPRDEKFKIYISALTQLNIDRHNRIPTTDARLVRRLVRDFQFRGAGALRTLQMWPTVRAGEEKNIFPFQEDADAVFNSALIYELAVLKKHAMPILRDIKRDIPEYSTAQNLIDTLEFFDDITEEEEIPNNSILREFIGHSCFFDARGDLRE